MTDETVKLPYAELIVANLLIEYIGYTCFQKIIARIKPQYVSCIIQVNTEEGFVSDSPYLHVFDHLDSVYHRIDVKGLCEAMEEMNYCAVLKTEESLPNRKKLVRIDFKQ